MALQSIGGLILEDGTIQSGTGDFTVSHSETGLYTISFEVKFDIFSTCIATLISGDTNAHVSMGEISQWGCQVKTSDSSGQPSDRSFSFIALGEIGYAATLGSEDSIGGNKQGVVSQGNGTDIHTVGDHAEFSATILELPREARGIVYISNVTTVPQTLVGDTADGIPTITIRPNTARPLFFHHVGTFTAHLKGPTPSANTTLMIIIAPPYVFYEP